MTDFAPFFATAVADGWTGYTRIFPNAMLFDQQGGVGRAVAVSNYDNAGQITTATHTDVDHVWKLSTSGGNGGMFVGWRGTSTGGTLQPESSYFVEFNFTTTPTLQAKVRKNVGGVNTDITGYSTLTGFTVAPGEFFLRVQHIDTALKIKAWTGTLAAEPATWLHESVQADHTTGRWSAAAFGYELSAGKVYTFDGPAPYSSEEEPAPTLPSLPAFIWLGGVKRLATVQLIGPA